MSDIAVRQDVNWVLKVVLGTGVPEVDTDGLTRAAQQLTSAADEMTGDWASLLTAARQTAIAYSGQAAETMRTAVADLESFRLQIARTLQGLAEGVRASADEVDYSTLAITIQAALLLGEISVEMAMAPFTAGASLDEVPEQIAEAQSLIRTILSKLLELLKQLLHAVGVNAGSGVAADAVAQLAQIGSGHRSTFDVLQTLQTAAFAAWAALFGAAAGPGGRQLGKFLASLGRAGLPKAFADGIGMVLDHTFGDGTESGVGGELGAAVGRYLSSGGGQDAAKALDREFHEALGKRLPADAGAGFTHGLARDLALATHRALESGATAEHGVGPVLRANITDVLNAYLPRWVEDRQKAALAPGIAKAGAGLEHSVADTFSKRALHAVGDNVAMGASILPGETSYQAMTGQPVSVNWYDPVSGAVGGQLTHTLTDAAQTIARRRNSMDGMPADAPPTDVAAPDIAAADSAGAKPRVTVETRPAAAAGSGATRGAVPSGRGPAARRSPEEPEITVAVGIAREKPLPGLPGDASAVPVRGEAGAGSDSDRTVSASAHVAADESRPRTVRPETARPDTPAASPTASQAKPGTPAAPPTPGRRVPAGPPAGTGRVARTAVTVRGDQVEVGGIPHSAADLAAKLTAAGTARHVVVLDHDSRGDQPVLARFAADLARRTGLDVVVPQFPLKTWHDGTAAGTIRVDSTGTPRPKPVEGRWTRHSPGGADGSGSPDGTAVKFVADFATATRERPPAGSADAAVPGPDSPVAAARNRGAARDLTTATEFARPPDDPHHWEHQAAKDAARLQVTEFADPAAAASFLARFGVGYGHTLHLREGRDRDTVGDEAAARNMLADATGRITVAAHGDGEHLLVGGYALAPEGLGQVLQAHPDWEAIRRFGVRLAVCDAGAPVVTSRSWHPRPRRSAPATATSWPPPSTRTARTCCGPSTAPPRPSTTSSRPVPPWTGPGSPTPTPSPCRPRAGSPAGTTRAGTRRTWSAGRRRTGPRHPAIRCCPGISGAPAWTRSARPNSSRCSDPLMPTAMLSRW
jgi:hypothetical protein